MGTNESLVTIDGQEFEAKQVLTAIADVLNNPNSVEKIRGQEFGQSVDDQNSSEKSRDENGRSKEGEI